MSRALYAGCLVGGMVLAAAGCRMCAHPYDYCGPIVNDPIGCCPTARAGSILTAGNPGTVEGTLVSAEAKKNSASTKGPQSTRALSPPKPIPAPAPRRAPTPAPAPTKTVPTDQSASHFFPGIPKKDIISITDRRLDESDAKETASVAQEEPTPPEAKMPVVRAASAPAISTTPMSPIRQTGWTPIRHSSVASE